LLLTALSCQLVFNGYSTLLVPLRPTLSRIDFQVKPMSASVTIPLLAFAACFLLTRVMRMVAMRFGIVDAPDGRRKLQRKAIPLGGGVGICLSIQLALAISLALPGAPDLFSNYVAGLLIAVNMIVVIGLTDDRFQLRGRQKLVGQTVTSLVLVLSGLVVQRIQVFSWHIELGLLSVPFTMLWLVGAMNALNLIDGIDGLATGVGIILSLAIAGMAVMTGHPTDAMMAMALCGALLGFLVYNFPPASIYLGDAGSMLIGLMLGALAIRCSLKGPATVALAAPSVIWTIPMFDVGMAILRRKLTGRSIYETDRGHLHHCLLRQGFSNRTTLIWVGAFCSCTAAGALLSIACQNEWLAVGSALAVVCTLVLTRWFGHAECLLLGRRLQGLVMSLIQMPGSSEKLARQPVRDRLTGTRDWDELWDTLTVFAEQFDLSSVQLNVNLPAMNEEYHVNWERRERGPQLEEWFTDLPLVSNNVTIGRLRIRGHCSQGSVCTWMGDLIAGLKPFETQMLSLIVDRADNDDQKHLNQTVTPVTAG